MTGLRITPLSLSLSLSLFPLAAEAADPTRVVLPDGSYTYEDPDRLSIGARQTEGAFIWEYVEQQVYPPLSERIGAGWDDGDEPTSETLIDKLWRTKRIDRYGRVWVVAEVDRDELAARLGVTVGEVDLVPASDYGVYTDVVADGAWAYPMLDYGLYDCRLPTGVDEALLESTEHRVNLDTMTGRQTKVMFITGPLGGCTGVMVDDDSVLTAAHCVVHGSGQYIAREPELHGNGCDP